MGKKQYQSHGKYTRKANQAKKKQPNRPAVPSGAASPSSQDEPSDDPVPSIPLTSSRSQSTQPSASYPYLASDLTHTAIIAGIAFVILIILYVVL